ncbi:hypothetical protein E3U23_10305 [Erythrobacter litoralis]|uniref:hypothetical protein n=1 Tax=Erythrobacter litoralis TaxID=39960 RepID=UPI002435B3B6|nr:hypothetical protein [Erythrobacter litoralis]MDG6079586.1 hypothetical protein [Erythrobacter litoralis]
MKPVALLFALVFFVAACGGSEPEPAPTPTPTVAQPRTLVAADLDLSTLGAKIVGPEGSEVETLLADAGGQIGTMTSYVACPEGTSECNPATLPDGTLYTYVHRITLTEQPDAQPTSGPAAIEAPPTLFRTTEPVSGFDGAIGYRRAEAEAALGASDAISVSVEAGRLTWRVTQGTWKPDSTITFWWRSTVPPQSPAENYLFEIDGNQVGATGPFPPLEKAGAARSAS